ncbi:DUF2087 domain-containing protein [Clostridium sp. BL-8]|uniref:DUF2087 domain-containing protein n=1 Tax=Clostridium sp. BL-8 TaxID=349938 RepID=UPI0009CF0737|nr:DUF2087 domain-containing protein [Clostridium sp. BL-8]OOM77107.1 hypothetical protein CLOBL_31100 [Clostridium sp. BL-8]
MKNDYKVTEKERENVLRGCFRLEGGLKLKSFPVKEKKKIIVLEIIANEFNPSNTYSEKEINEIIKNISDDYVFIRRCLIEYGFLDRTRNGSDYWVKKR